MTETSQRISPEEQRELTTQALSDALRDVFGEGKSSGRFVDVSRIPLICKNIEGIHAMLEEIREQLKNGYVKTESFAPIQEKVRGINENITWAIRIILGAIILAVLGLIIMK